MKRRAQRTYRSLYPSIKDLTDRSGATVLLILFAPVLLLTAVLLGSGQRGEILFRQVRAGRHGHPFTLYKFKTMRDVRDRQGCLLPDKERITPLGRFLRASSIDELPQLINVIRGEMSLVGPRPLYVDYITLYTDRQALRMRVKPGITGLAQINGRNQTTWEKRLELDAQYVDALSFKQDVRILFLTLFAVFSFKNTHHGDAPTMPMFSGSPKGTEKLA